MKKRIVLLTVACMCTLAACVPAAKEPTAGSSDIAANVSSTVQTDDVSEEKTYIMGAEQFPAALDPANEWDGWFTVRYGFLFLKIKIKSEFQAFIAKLFGDYVIEIAAKRCRPPNASS